MVTDNRPNIVTTPQVPKTPKAPVPEIPELFPGFREMIAQEEQRFGDAQFLLKGLERAQQSLLERTTRPVPGIMSTESLKGLGPLAGGLSPQAMQLIQSGTQQFLTDEQKAIREGEARQLRDIGRQVEMRLAQMQKADWKLSMLNALPILLQLPKGEGGIETFEDVFDFAPPDLSESDREFIQTLVGRLKPAADEVLQEAGEPQNREQTANVIQRLQERRGSFSRLFSIDVNAMAATEILSTIRAASRFELPPGVSSEDLRDMLRERAFTEEELEAYDSAAAEAKRMLRQIRERDVFMSALREDAAKLSSGQIESLIDQARMSRALMQPALLFMKPLEYYINRVSRPIAGIYTRQVLTWNAALFGEEEARIEQVYRQARDEGVSYWEANRIAFDNWDVNGIAKFAVEVAVDPLTYFGFGLYTKVFQATRIPILGSAVRMAELGYVRAAQVPFDVARELWVGFTPRTVLQRGVVHSKEVGDLTREFIDVTYNKLFGNVPAEEMISALTISIENALTNPQGAKIGDRVGKALLGYRTVSAREVETLITEIGTKEITVTPDMLNIINRIAEQTDSVMGISKFLKPNESAPLLVKALDLTGSPEQVAAAVKFLNRVREGIRKGALAKLQGENPVKILGNIIDRTREEFIAAQKSLIANKRYQEGIVARMLDNLDSATRAVFIDKIERWVTLPFARAYLLFPALPVFNVMEIIIKSILSGVNPFRRGGTYRAMVKFHGLRGDVPIELFEEEARFTLQAQFPEEAVKLMASGVRLSKKELAQAQQDTSNWMMKMMTGRWIRNFVGTDVETLSLYNWGARVGNALKRNYHEGMFDKLMAQKFPKELGAVEDVVNLLTNGMEGLADRKTLKAARQELAERILTGDLQFTKNMVREFHTGEVMAAEAAKILEPLVEISVDVSDMIIRKVSTGEMFRAGPAGVSDIFKNTLEPAVHERYIHSFDFYRRHFADALTAIRDWQPTDINMLNYKMNFMDNAVETYGEVARVILSASHDFVSRLSNPVQIDNFWAMVYSKHLIPHATASARDLSNLIQSMIDSLPVGVKIQGMDTKTQEIYLQILKQHLGRIARVQDIQAQQAVVRARFFEKGGAEFRAPGKARDAAWWNNYRREANQPWLDLEDEILKGVEIVADLKSRTGNLVTTHGVDASQRTLVTKDVADLFGVTPSTLSREMYIPELMALRGRKQFQTLTRSRARVMAQRMGKNTPEDIGFTDEAINRVYDEIMFKFKADPGIGQDIAPALTQLETARQELIRLGQRRQAIISDDVTGFLSEQLEGKEIAEIVPSITEQPLIPFVEGPQTPAGPGLVSKEIIARQKAVTMMKIKLEDMAGRSGPRLAPAVVKWFEKVDNPSLQTIGRLASERPEYVAGIHAILRERYPSGFIRVFRGTGNAKGRPLEREFVNVSADRETASTFQKGGTEWFVAATPDIDDVIVKIEDVLSIASVDESELILPAKLLQERLLHPLTVAGQIEVRPGISVARRSVAELRASVEGFTRTAKGKDTKVLIQARTKLRLAEEELERRLQSARLDVTIPKEQSPLDRLIKSNPQLRRIFSPEWQDVRKDIMQETRKNYFQDFPDYENPTAVTATMKSIFPFWTYEAHRWAWWLPREFTRHPGVYAGWGKYLDNSDNGYFHIPGTDLDINPMRGNIMQGGMSRLQRRDFPEYYDTFPGFAGVMDQLSRFGYYPGAPLGLMMAMFGAKTGQIQLGEVLPTWQRSVLDMATVVAPNQAQFLRDLIFPDRFRDFIIARQAAKLGYQGIGILIKRIQKIPLTELEQQQWTEASRGISRLSIMTEPVALFRIRPEERERLVAASDAIISEWSGVPVRELKDLRKVGLSFEDVFGPLDPEIHRMVNTLEGWSRYGGATITLQPSEFQQRIAIQREFWGLVESERQTMKNELALVEARMRTGEATMDQWLIADRDGKRGAVNLIDSLRQPDPVTGTISKFADIPMTIDERMEFAQKYGLHEPIFAAIEELRQLYFQEELNENWLNPDTGRIEPDWDSLFAFREAIEQSLPDDVLQRFIALNQAEDTELQQLHFNINREFFRPYNAIFDVVLEQFSPAEQALIQEHRIADTDRRLEIQEVTTQAEPVDPDRKLISLFNQRLSIAHENMRDVDSELDAWLNVFRRVRSFRTPKAEQRFQEIMSGLGLRP